MSELDPVSVKVGEFGNKLENLTITISSLSERVDKVLDYIPRVDSKADRAHVRLDGLTDPQTGTLTIAAAQAQDWADTKKKATWIGTGLVGSSLVGGTVLGTWLTKISSIFGGTGT